MVKKLLVLLLLAFLAGNAEATEVSVMDAYSARLDAIASYLGLKPSLPEVGLAGLWPGEVKKLADLHPVIATVAGPS